MSEKNGNERNNFLGRLRNGNLYSKEKRIDVIMEENFTGFYENKEGAFEGIVYYSTRVIHNKERSMSNYNEKNQKTHEEKLQELVDEVMRLYEQFYKFSVMNDNKIPIERVEKVVMNHQNILTLEEYNTIRNNIKSKLVEMFGKNNGQIMLMDFKQGIYFNDRQFDRKWTQDLVRALDYLHNLEETNKKEYYIQWVKYMLKREEKGSNNRETINSLNTYIEEIHNQFETNEKGISL